MSVYCHVVGVYGVLGYPKLYVLDLGLNFLHAIPTVSDPEGEGFEKHCGKKMHLTNIFFFSHSVFYSIT